MEVHAAVICMEGEDHCLQAVLLAEGDMRGWRALLSLHPACVQNKWWFCRGCLLGAGNRHRSGFWWNKRFVDSKRDQAGIMRCWINSGKQHRKRGSGIKTPKVQCRIFLAWIKESYFRKCPFPLPVAQHGIFAFLSGYIWLLLPLSVIFLIFLLTWLWCGRFPRTLTDTLTLGQPRTLRQKQPSSRIQLGNVPHTNHGPSLSPRSSTSSQALMGKVSFSHPLLSGSVSCPQPLWWLGTANASLPTASPGPHLCQPLWWPGKEEMNEVGALLGDFLGRYL